MRSMYPPPQPADDHFRSMLSAFHQACEKDMYHCGAVILDILWQIGKRSKAKAYPMPDLRVVGIERLGLTPGDRYRGSPMPSVHVAVAPTIHRISTLEATLY